MSKVTEVVEQAQKLGGRFAELVQPYSEWRARGFALSAELESLRRHEESNYPGLVDLVASGKLEPSGLVSHASSLGVWVYDSPASKVVHQAAGIAHEQANRALSAVGPRLFAEAVRVAGGCVDESVKLTVKLPKDVVSEQKAFASRQPEVVQTWHRLRDLVDCWDALHALVWALMSANVVEGPPSNFELLPARWVKFENPQALPGNYSKLAGELKLAVAKAYGAGPGIYDWATAVKWWRKWALANAEVGTADYRAAQAVPSQRMLTSDEIDPMTGLPWKGLPADAVAKPAKAWVVS